MSKSPEWCAMVHEGYDTDGTEWNRCTVHGELVIGDAYVCEDYVAPAYVEGFGSGWFTLVDGDGYLWVYVGYGSTWACVLDLSDEHDTLDLSTASISVYQGFDSWVQIAETHGIDGGA